MKIRRYTLAVLVLLTLLFLVDVRYVQPHLVRSGEPSVRFHVRPLIRTGFTAEKSQVFTRPQGQLTSLMLQGSFGTVEVVSSSGEDLVIRTTIAAEKESDLEGFEVRESISDSELSYELAYSGPEPAPAASLSYQVEVPAGMEVSVVYSYGQVEVKEFVGFLQLLTSFSRVYVQELQGSLSVNNAYGSVELKGIAGPLRLDNVFATSLVDLAPVDGGYYFQVEVTNGRLQGQAPLEREVRQNSITAQGRYGEGVHPVVINSSFGTVTLNLEP